MLAVAAILCAAAAAQSGSDASVAPGSVVVGVQALSQGGNTGYAAPGGQQQFGGLISLQQSAGRGGLFTLTLDSATGGGRWRSGDNFATWRNAPLFGGQADFFAGTLDPPTDLLGGRFNTLFLPGLTLAGGEVSVRGGGWRFTTFAGRNLVAEGPYLPFYTSAPDLLWGATLRAPRWGRWQWEARYLRTRANEATAFGAQLNPVPASSQEVYLDGDLNLGARADWMNEVSISRAAQAGVATGAAAGAAAGASPTGGATSPGTALSFFTGPSLAAPAYDLQAYALRQSATYFPVSNEAMGDREGAYVGGDLRPAKALSVSGSLTDMRNNVAANAGEPTLDAFGISAGANYDLGDGTSVAAEFGRTNLAQAAGFGGSGGGVGGGGGAAGETNFTTAQIQAQRNYGENQTLIRWQDWRTTSSDGAVGDSTIRTEELDQQRIWRASTLSAGVSLQQGFGAGGATAALNANLGVNLALGRRASFYASGQLGRDLRDQSALSLTTMRGLVTELRAQLPGHMELSAEYVRDSVVSRLNAERVFLGALGGEPVALLPATGQRAAFVRLTRSFRWGAALPSFSGLPADLAARLIPQFGTITGQVYDDAAEASAEEEAGGKDGTARRRAAGRAGVAGIVVTLNGREATTDAEGRYRFTGVRVGEYALGLDLDHLPTRYSAVGADAYPVAVRGGAAVVVNIPLEVVGGIEGRLLLRNPQPGQGQPATGSAGQRGAASEKGPVGWAGAALRLAPGNQLAFTDERGDFHFDAVAPGSYRLILLPQSLPEHAVIPLNGAAVEVRSGEITHGVRLSFQMPATPPPSVVTVVEAPEAIQIPPAAAAMGPGSRATSPPTLRPASRATGRPTGLQSPVAGAPRSGALGREWPRKAARRAGRAAAQSLRHCRGGARRPPRRGNRSRVKRTAGSRLRRRRGQARAASRPAAMARRVAGSRRGAKRARGRDGRPIARRRARRARVQLRRGPQRGTAARPALPGAGRSARPAYARASLGAPKPQAGAAHSRRPRRRARLRRRLIRRAHALRVAARPCP